MLGDNSKCSETMHVPEKINIHENCLSGPQKCCVSDNMSKKKLGQWVGFFCIQINMNFCIILLVYIYI